MLKALWKIWRKTMNNTQKYRFFLHPNLENNIKKLSNNEKIKNELIIVCVATGSHSEILEIA